jgi:DNA-binding transcriptional ArsR family regulator
MSAMPATSAPDTFCEVNIAPVATLMADSARAVMLVALLDDRPLAAGELARVAGVTPATASAHLARLLHGGLVVAQRQGRHRYYRLAGHDVAQAIEALAHLSSPVPVRSLRHSQDAAALDSARTCYDHLAGRAGVALFGALLSRGLITRHPPTPLKPPAPEPRSAPAPEAPSHSAAQAPSHSAAQAPSRSAAQAPSRSAAQARPHFAPKAPSARAPRARSGPAPRVHEAPQARSDLPPEAETGPAIIRLTAGGEAALAAFGIDIGELRGSRRRFIGECLDWTQRRSHLNGAVGAALTARLFELGWIERGKRRRAVRVTPAGEDGLAATFGCSLNA